MCPIYGIAGTKTPGSRIRDRSKTAWAIRSTPIHSQRYTGKPRLSRIVLAKPTKMMLSFAKGDRCRKPRKSLTKSVNSPHQLYYPGRIDGAYSLVFLHRRLRCQGLPAVDRERRGAPAIGFDSGAQLGDHAGRNAESREGLCAPPPASR